MLDFSYDGPEPPLNILDDLKLTLSLGDHSIRGHLQIVENSFLNRVGVSLSINALSSTLCDYIG